MRCGKCQQENPLGSSFCLGCGARLGSACASCGAELPAGSRFCNRCGAPLQAEIGVPSRLASPASYTPKYLAEKILTSRSALEGERKQVTVLFCDIANSTPLAERLGPEAMHDLLRRFFDVALEQVHRYEGTVNQFLGDGFMALFGAPVAHEDHARRTVLAAWSLQRALAEAAEGVAVRMGLNTGLVVVGSIGDNLRMDYTAVGDTTNLAARLQQLAEPGQILLGETTYRLVRDLVRFEPLGARAVKGRAEPATAYRLVGLGPSRSPLATRIEHRLSRFAGRRRELRALLEALEDAERGRGQVLGIVGDPGLGKSRLVYEFRGALADRRVTYLEGRCLSYASAIPYLPIIEIVRANCGIADTDTPDAIAAKVRLALDELGVDAEESVSHLLHLLGLKEGTRALEALTAEAIRERTFETLHQMCLRGARQRTVIFGVEDLHWIDNASEAFLAALVDRIAGASILLVTTYRPGYHPPWMDKSYATQVGLRPLDSDDGQTVLESVLGERFVGDDVRRAVLAKAEGNPFFLEELTEVVVDHADGAGRGSVPDTIQDVLMARIDRLAEGPKRLLQIAAVLGREAPHRLLAAMWDGPNPVEPYLAELRRQEFLFEAAGEDRVYVFKHMLTQEVAYESLLAGRRRALHAAAAGALESAYEGRLEEVYGTLAYHWGRTDDAERAIVYLLRAAESAARSHAHVEATELLRQALTQVDRLPEEQRDRHRVEIVICLSDSQHRLGRYRENVEILQAYLDVVDRLDDPTLTGPYHLVLGQALSFGGDRENAGVSVMRGMAAATQCDDKLSIGVATILFSLEQLWAGRHEEAAALGQRASNLLDAAFDVETHPTLARLRAGSVISYRSIAWFLQAFAHVLRGEFAQARHATRQIVAIGEAARDGRIQCDGLGMLGLVSAFSGEEGAVEACERAIAVAPDPWNAALVQGFLGQAHLEHGDVAVAAAVLEAAVEQADRYRSMQVRSWFRSLLADSYRCVGRLEEAGAIAENALGLAAETRFPRGVWLATRAQGRLALAAGRLAEARERLEEAHRGFAGLDCRYDVAWAQVDLALIARAEGRPDVADTTLADARAMFQAMGAQNVDERIERLARTLVASQRAAGSV